MSIKYVPIALLLSLSAHFALAQESVQHAVPGRINSPAQEKEPYVIMISIDGFRYDYADKFQAQNLLELSNNGVCATAMQPSFPSLTFPNHYTLVTGLYPAHHGLVDNTFWDRGHGGEYMVANKKVVEDSSWYQAAPLWVLAEKQQMLTASYFWVGSEAAIQGVRPTYWYHYQEKTPLDTRVQAVVDWLAMPAPKRPHLITFYFPEVDHAGHTYGPDAQQTKEAVRIVDESIGKMVKAVSALNLPVNFIVVSDHGMTTVDTVHTIHLKDMPGIKQEYGQEKVMYYSNDTVKINAAYAYFKQHEDHFRAYLKRETPLRWHYGQEDTYNRIGDLILVADAGYVFASNKPGDMHPGHHGFDNNLTEMNAVFMAWGPAFKQHKRIATFENVNVFPLVAHILGLKPEGEIDGKLEVLEKILAGNGR